MRRPEQTRRENKEMKAQSTESLIGKTYQDPEGIWEITAVDEDRVEIRQVQEGNLNYGFESEVSLEEAEYYLNTEYPW